MAPATMLRIRLKRRMTKKCSVSVIIIFVYFCKFLEHIVNQVRNNKLKDDKPPRGYFDFLIIPLKFAGSWNWIVKPKNDCEIIMNNVFLGAILFSVVNLLTSLAVHIYFGWTDMMSSLDLLSDGIPIVVSVFVVSYISVYKQELHELFEFTDKSFKWHSARGVSNMTMRRSYDAAKRFAHLYTAYAFFSVTTYIFVPIVMHLITDRPLPWMYEEVTNYFIMILIFLRHCIVQANLALSLGQLGVFFTSSSILLCGQLDLLCCSLRNLRFTALLKKGVRYQALLAQFRNIQDEEKHNYTYNEAHVENSYDDSDENVKDNGSITVFDIYDADYDDETCSSIAYCARMQQVIKEFKSRFQNFISPLLVIRVIHCTVYLCTLLYSATVKFDLATVVYFVAVAVDIFMYCYYGNQIIIQANRVSEAAYQSAWITMGVRPRRMLLNIMLSSRKPMIIRAGNFLPIDLETFIVIMKTSFSYYTLLVNVNENKNN